MKEPPQFSGATNDTNVKAYVDRAKEFLAQFERRLDRVKLNALRMGLNEPARGVFRRTQSRILTPRDLFALLHEYYPRQKVPL